MKALMIVAVPALMCWFLLYRVSGFRKDRARGNHYFGTPLESMAEVLTKHNYTEQGQKLLPWLAVSLALLVLATLLAAGLIARGSG